MGNESSTLVADDVAPQTLESRTLEGVAKYIKEKNVRRIVVMVRENSNSVMKLTFSNRQARGSVHLLGFQTFVLPIQDFMQTLHA